MPALKIFFLKNKESVINSIVIVVCLVLSVFFPTQNAVQNLLKDLFFLFVIPILYIKLVLKKNIADFGLNIQNKKVGIFWAGMMLLMSLAIAFIAIQYSDFPKVYRLSSLVVSNFWFFLLDMLVFLNIMLFLQEFFFHGFVMLPFMKKMKVWTIFIQFILFFVFLLLIGGDFQKKLWMILPFLILSLTGGITAYKSKSVIYSYASGLLFLIIINAYLIKIT